MTDTAPLRRPVRVAVLSVLLAGSIGLLSGCAPEPGPVGPTGSASPTATTSAPTPPTSPPTPSPSGSATAEPEPVPTQPDLGEAGPGCSAVLSADDVYAFNPNLSAVAAPSPAAGSALATAVSLDGTACRWNNDTSNEPIDVAVAVPGEAELRELQSDARSTATATDAFTGADAGFFDLDGSVGTVQAFADGRWIVMSSPIFLEAGDAEPLVSAIVANLG